MHPPWAFSSNRIEEVCPYYPGAPLSIWLWYWGLSSAVASYTGDLPNGFVGYHRFCWSTKPYWWLLFSVVPNLVPISYQCLISGKTETSPWGSSPKSQNVEYRFHPSFSLPREKLGHGNFVLIFSLNVRGRGAGECVPWIFLLSFHVAGFKFTWGAALNWLLDFSQRQLVSCVLCGERRIWGFLFNHLAGITLLCILKYSKIYHIPGLSYHSQSSHGLKM